MLRVALRLQRAGFMGMAAFGILYGVIQSAAYSSAAGTTTAQRVAFGHQMEVVGRSFSYLLPIPVHVETISGYLQWRVYGALPLLFVFWALMSAAGATRGDEDRGLVEQWISAGVDPVRYVVARVAVFLLAALLSVAATSAAIYAGALSAGSSLDLPALAEQSAALVAVTFAGYGVALVAAQLTGSRNTAAGLGGVVLLVMFFVNGFSRTADGLRPAAAALSPFYYYDRSNPLTPGGAADGAACAELLVAAVALAALAASLMRTRDLGSPLLRLPIRPAARTQRPASNPLLRLPVLAGLYEQRVGLIAWGLGSALAAAFIASIGHSMVDLVKGPGAFRAYLTAAGHGDPYVAITSFFWFGIFEMLLAVYAITQVARWSADDNEGRLEMVLSAPVSRARVVGERALTLIAGTLIVVAISSGGFLLSARAAGIGLRAGDLATAALLLVPFVLSFAAIGALLASRVPRATVAVLTTVAFASYLLTEAGPLMKWPDWTLRFSLFSLYGNPLTAGVNWTGLWILLAVSATGFGLAALLIQRRDVGA